MREAQPLVWGPPETLLGTAGPTLSHCLVRTLGLRPGDTARLVCGDGFVHGIRLLDADPRAVRLEFLERTLGTADPAVEITLYVGALKGDQMTYVIQQLTELGVYRIVPLETERSFRRLPFKSHARWQQTAWDSTVLCGRSRAPEIHPGMTFGTAIQGGGVLLRERHPELPGLRSVLQKVSSIFVGPEQGFSDSEVQQAVQAGLVCCTMGPRMLRGLTAAIAAVTIALAERKDLA